MVMCISVPIREFSVNFEGVTVVAFCENEIKKVCFIVLEFSSEL